MALGGKLGTDFEGASPCGLFDHPAHQIHTEHRFGDAMFHLQTGIHFQEVELVILGIVNKFNGTCRAVLNTLYQAEGRSMEGFTSSLRKARSRSFFNNLLVTALHGAIAFTENNGITFTITENLDFYVAATFHILFYKESCVLEVVFAKTLNTIIAFAEFCFAVANCHTNAATACSALKHDGVTNLASTFRSFINTVQKASTGNQGNAKFFSQFLTTMLQTKFNQLLGSGANKGDAIFFQGLCKFCIFA